MTPIVDFSYLEELAEGKTEFIQQVLSIFMDNTPKGLVELEKMITTKASFDTIQKQAHFLKSSFGIVKANEVYERLQKIESLARTQSNRAEIETLMKEIKPVFNEAETLIKKKMEGV